MLKKKGESKPRKVSAFVVNVTNIDLIKEEMSPFQKTSIKHSLGKKLQQSSQEHQFSSLAGRNKEARCFRFYGFLRQLPVNTTDGENNWNQKTTNTNAAQDTL